MASLVRNVTVDVGPTVAGDFRAHAFGGGRIPGWLIRSLAIHCVDTRDRVMAIGYDDGPDPAGTTQVLDSLRRHDVPATFFMLSDAAEAHPDLVHRVVDEGHEVAVHGKDHRSLLTVPDKEARRSIRHARDVIRAVSGQPVRLFRPPFEQYAWRHTNMVRALGMRFILWSGEAADWIEDRAENVADRAIRAVHPGGILLLHDTRADPLTGRADDSMPTFDRGAVLDQLLDAVLAEGYHVVTVSELIARYPNVHTIPRQRMKI